ncbi:MAG: hypothetical protein NVSMB6_03780 [Burkholderiaceae bacterium]
MSARVLLLTLFVWGAGCHGFALQAHAGDMVQTIVAVKPAVVAIATTQKLRSPATVFFGTGFAVGDGLTIVTNAHVVITNMDSEKNGALGVLVGAGQASEFRLARVAAMDREHDLAILKINGAPLPSLQLASTEVVEGQLVAFTGFPLGMMLGYHHATHRAMVSAITPVLQPAISSKGLDAKTITQLQRSAYKIIQLDGTAYPGNSGSPVYEPTSGLVYGIVNMVYVKGLKESAISQPSGITYAIPSAYILDLLATLKK